MKNRYAVLAILILILPIAVYFTYYINEADETPAFIPKHRSMHKQHRRHQHHPKEQCLTKMPAIKHVIQHFVTSNGAKVLLVETHDIPMVDIQINLNAGSARDGKNPGLSMLLSHLLDKGTQNLSPEAIAEKFENAGALYRTHIDRDSIKISLRSLSEKTHLNPSVDLLAQLLANATFSKESIELEKNQMIMGIKQKKQHPNVTASIAFSQALYKLHPYAHPVFGTEEGISTISAQDLIKFHQEYFVAKNAVITIVGDVSRQEAEKITNQLTQKWLSGKAANMLPKVAALTTAVELNIPFTSEQTHVMLGQPCAIEGDPDYFSLLVGNYILGGNPLNSRLFKEVRDDRGLVYSVSSAFMQYQQPAPFVIQLQTKNSQTEEAIEVVKKTLAHFIKEGPTEQEVLEAKQGIIRSFPLEINNNANISEMISMIGFYQLPLDYLDTYQQQVEKITVADVKSAFQRRIDPNKMALIRVGSTPH